VLPALAFVFNQQIFLTAEGKAVPLTVQKRNFHGKTVPQDNALLEHMALYTIADMA
jgi:hypothetical protein